MIDVNELRRLIEQYDQSGMSDAAYMRQPQLPDNMLARYVNQPIATSEQQAYANAPGDQLPMNSLRDEQTGKMTYFGPSGGFSDEPYASDRVGTVPGQKQRIKLAGYGGGIMSDLGETTAAAPVLDYSRAAVDTPQGKGQYGKDGKVYVKGADGSLTQINLGYDREASYLAAKRRFELQKSASDLEHTAAATEHTQEQTRASRANNPDFGSAAAAAGGLAGDALLQSLDPGMAGIIKQMVDGRASPPTGAALRSPRMMQLLALANQYDPGFDATTWAARFKTAQDFASGGNSGKKTQAINQAIHHAGQLSEAIDSLNNTDIMPGIINAPVNLFEQKILGDTRQGVYKEKADALAAELRKVYAGAGGGTLHELEKWQSTFDPNAGQAQQRAYLRGGMELLQGAINSHKENFERGMGPRADFGKIISPTALSDMARVMSGEKTSVPAPPAVNAPPAAIQYLKANPQMRSAFDMKYGQGASAQVLGQ